MKMLRKRSCDLKEIVGTEIEHEKPS